jgi:GNAT superfamily N-acetyltransferase
MQKFKYEIKVFKLKEINNLFSKYINQNIVGDIHYFSYSDCSTCFCSDTYIESCKYVVAYNKKQILGICKIAVFELSNKYVSISYCSVHKNYQNRGIGRALIEKGIEVVKTYNMPLNTSQYSVLGWKYLRPVLIKLCEKNNIVLRDSVVGYGDHNEEFFKLREESIKNFQEKYQTEYYY